MSTLPYKVIDCSNGRIIGENRIGFDTASLLHEGTILSVPEGRFVVMRKEIDLCGPEAYMVVYVRVNKFTLISPHTVEYQAAV